MEALTAVAVALLTVYDMAKALDRGMETFRYIVSSEVGWTRRRNTQELMARALPPYRAGRR